MFSPKPTQTPNQMRWQPTQCTSTKRRQQNGHTRSSRLFHSARGLARFLLVQKKGSYAAWISSFFLQIAFHHFGERSSSLLWSPTETQNRRTTFNSKSIGHCDPLCHSSVCRPHSCRRRGSLGRDYGPGVIAAHSSKNDGRPHRTTDSPGTTHHKQGHHPLRATHGGGSRGSRANCQYYLWSSLWVLLEIAWVRPRRT
jgi:hypothetical protein